jgi:HSP20 family protein
MVATPRMDVRENEDEILIETDLPGVSEKDIEVRLDDDVLTIRGERKTERREDKDNYHVMERSMGAFQRSMRLPFHVDPAQVKASFENGVLAVRLPKTPAQVRSRRIEVKKGAGQAAAAHVASEARSFAGNGGRTENASQPTAAETGHRAEETPRAATPK